MAIQRVNIPTSGAPVSTADYVAQNAWMAALALAASGRNPVDGSTIHSGTCFMIGGVPYKSVSDTTISGSVTKYCKITKSVDSLTATASFVSNLDGVSWSHAYGDYEDVSGNIYFFDEARAIFDGLLTTPYTLRGQMAYSYSDLTVNGDVSAEGGIIAGAGISATGSVTAGGDISSGGDISGDTLTLSSGIGELASICGYATPYLIDETVSSPKTYNLPTVSVGSRRDFGFHVTHSGGSIDSYKVVLPSGSYDFMVSSFGLIRIINSGIMDSGQILETFLASSEQAFIHGFYVRRS